MSNTYETKLPIKKSQRFEFMSNGHSLAARLDSPEEPKAFALYAHCFTCGKDLAATNRLVRALNLEGVAVFRFDFTGVGLSAGDFANTNFSTNVEDLVNAADYMRENYAAPRLMFGHSFGGTATLVAAHQVPECTAVATLGSPADTHHIQKQFAEHVDTIMAQGEAQVSLAGRPFRIKKQFIEDVTSQEIEPYVHRLGRALLVMHSPVDETVNVSNAERIYKAALHPKSFVSLDYADHLLLKNPADSAYAAKVIAAWAGRYIFD